MSEQAITNAIASGIVPADLTAAYLMESRDPSSIAAILSVGIIAIIVVAARLYARTFVVWSFGLDDILIIITTLLFMTFIGLCIKLLRIGTGRHTEYLQYILTDDENNATQIYDFAAHLIYTTALYVCRISGLAFYMRLRTRHTALMLTIKIAFGFLTVAYIPQMFLIVFHCLPVTNLWPYEWQSDINDYACIAWGVVYITNSSISLVSDLVVFTIPTILIHLYRGTFVMKLKLSLILFPGILVIVISCVRIYLVLQGTIAVDFSWPYGPMLAVETSEIGGTMIALSIPGLKSLFGNMFEKFSAPSGASGGQNDASGSSDEGSKRARTNDRWNVNLNPYRKGNNETTVQGGKSSPRLGSEEELFGRVEAKKEDGIMVTRTAVLETNDTKEHAA